MQAISTSPVPPSTADFVPSLRRLLKTYRRGGWLTINRAAKLAGISIRSFQRRLNHQGGVYSALVDKVRGETATEMLKNSDLSLKEIAQRLGYTNQGNFSRAYQRWTGMKPSEVRDRAIDD